MKRNLFFLLLLALSLPFAAFAQKTLPYSYGFENNDLDGEGWTKINPYSTTNTATGNAIRGGSRGFQFADNASVQQGAQYLVSPELTVGSEGMFASFWYRNYGTTYFASYNWGYSTTTNPEDVTWINGSDITTTDGNWHQTETFFCPATTKYVFVKCTLSPASGSAWAFVDEFSFIDKRAKDISNGYEYGFENNNLAAEGWLTQNAYYSGSAAPYTLQTKITTGAAINNGSYGFQFYYATAAMPQYLISPELSGTDNGVALTFSYGVWSGTQQFQVGYSTTTNETTAFTFGNTITANNATSATNKNFIELDETLFPAGTKYIAIKYSTSGYFFVDDIAISEPSPCEAPETLEATEVTTTTATITWSGGSGTYGIGIQETSANAWTSLENSYKDYSFTFKDLTPGTTYTARVQSICGDTESGFKSVTFTTNCEAVAVPYTYGFEDSESTKWNCWEKGTGITIATGSAIHAGAKGLQFYNANGQTFISPELEGTENGAAFNFYYGVYSGTQSFQVGYCVNDAWTWTENIEATNVTTPNSASYSGWLQYVTLVPANTTQVAIKCTSTGYFFVDDITIKTPKAFVTDGAWDDASNWSDGAVPVATDNVEVIAAAIINEGVVAMANNISVGSAGSITIKDGGQLKHHTSNLQVTVEKEIEAWTIEQNQGDTKANGWYFIANPLNAYIAVADYATKASGMLDNDKFDYYFFSAAATDGLEWRNYRAGAFRMNTHSGYLYANEETVTLRFTGATYRSSSSASNNFNVDYTYDETSTSEFNGWTLVGNPYLTECYLSYDGENYDFYVMNENNNGYEVTSRALKPCEGAFFNYQTSGKLTYSTLEPQDSESAMLEMTVSQGRSKVDNARVRFGEGNQLPKLSLREGSSKIYFPQGNKEYAVVRSQGEGELPINFKAEKNGTYTLSFDMENVEFNNLHLIDNLTGANIDLMANPTYTFEARTTDYASRFRLVFSANGIDENGDNGSATFAYFNGNEWVINASDNATVQVIDMMGRVVVSSDATRSVSTSNMKAGVYMLRLVDGNNVKTQKIVVR